MVPFGLAAPFINLACYGLIWYIAGWPYAVIVFGLYILTCILQVWTNRAQKRIKQTENVKNVHRMQLISDMITGIRTIKSYAGEESYGQKIRQQREIQVQSVFWLNLVGSLGFSIFQNAGFIGVLIIFTSQWYIGEALELSDSFALLALIYYLFFNINSMTVYLMNSYCQSYECIHRLSEVFRMKEH